MTALPAVTPNSPVYLYDGQLQRGPMPAKECLQLLQAGTVPSYAYFWTAGMNDWAPVHLFPQIASEAPPPAKNLILVVDDDALMRELLIGILESRGLSTRWAPGILPAMSLLDHLGTEAFDTVITDFEMPGGSGVELVRWIKNRERALQVLMLTAQDNKDVIKLGLRAGILDFLEKPVRETAFLNALDHALQETARQREEKAAFLAMVQQQLSGKGELAEKVIRDLVKREATLQGIISKLEGISKFSQQIENSQTFKPNFNESDSTPFQGSLRELAPLELIQILVQSQKCGELRFFRPDNTIAGCVFLKNGHFTHAETSTHSGMEALKSLLRLTDGFFRFWHGRESTNASLQAEGIPTLLDATSQIDTSLIQRLAAA
ncbi:MAG: response regulator [Verrucomicrobiia bacterium]